jgi:hypothetical protein
MFALAEILFNHYEAVYINELAKSISKRKIRSFGYYPGIQRAPHTLSFRRRTKRHNT